LQSFSQGILNVRQRVFCMNSWRETQSVPSERYEKRSLLLLWFGGERARHAPLPTSSWHRQLATNPHNVCVSRGVQHEPQRAVRGGGGGGVERNRNEAFVYESTGFTGSVTLRFGIISRKQPGI